MELKPFDADRKEMRGARNGSLSGEGNADFIPIPIWPTGHPRCLWCLISLSVLPRLVTALEGTSHGSHWQWLENRGSQGSARTSAIPGRGKFGEAEALWAPFSSRVLTPRDAANMTGRSQELHRNHRCLSIPSEINSISLLTSLPGHHALTQSIYESYLYKMIRTPVACGRPLPSLLSQLLSHMIDKACGEPYLKGEW